MKLQFSAIICLLVATEANAQYYYKDIIATRNTATQFQKFKEQKVRSVTLKSFESDGSITEGFRGSQSINANFTTQVTNIESSINGSSQLTTSFNTAGLPMKTVDTTDGAGSVSDYTYNDKGQLESINNVASSPGPHTETEEHLWYYDDTGKPNKMLRIKNTSDTTFFNFVYDEKGNVGEEDSKRNGIGLPTIYYYYDGQNRLTDIVNYNRKAARLLPAYVFEYTDKGLMNSMLVVPEGSSDYQRWQYTYNDAGLKTKETCLNKHKQIVGRIEYVYQ
ncbi:MAG: hypothetical protein ABI415_05115 [Flavitalea sp.]